MSLIGSQPIDCRVAIGEARQWIVNEFAQRAKEIEARYEKMKADSFATRRLNKKGGEKIEPRIHLWKMERAYTKAHNKLMDRRKAALDALTDFQIWLASITPPPATPLKGEGSITPAPPVKEEGEGMPLEDARAVAQEIARHLAPFCQRLAIAGSVRRGNKARVKDIELVVIPTPDLWRVLDEKVAAGKIAKATYGKTKSVRWGDKYRGFVWSGMKIEVFAATPENWGYQYLLRTGPGDANTVIMTVLKQRQAPFKFKDGYAVRADDEKQIIPLAEEKDVFTLLGLDYVPAGQRTVERYWREFNRKGHTWGSV